MTVSVVLRLVSEVLDGERVAGHAEIVDTGESAVFKDQEEMLAFLRQASRARVQREGGHDGSDVRDGTSSRP